MNYYSVLIYKVLTKSNFLPKAILIFQNQSIFTVPKYDDRQKIHKLL